MTGLVLRNAVLDEDCYRVRLALALLALPCRTLAAEAGTEVPALEDEDGRVVLREPAAILAYLALRHDPARSWMPADPATAAQVVAWLAFAAGALRPAVLARRRALFDEPADPAAIPAARQAFRALEDHLADRGLGGAAWVVGDGPTLADLVVFPSVALGRDYGVEHDPYPALRRWMRRVRGLPGFVSMPGIPDYH